MKKLVVPSIIASTPQEMKERIERVKPHVKRIQIDVMDGKFVKNTSNWFDFELPDFAGEYEAHLMVDDPEAWIEKHIDQFDILLANIERVDDPIELIDFVKKKHKKMGFVLNPETELDELIPYLDELDQVLLMTVHPGQYGAPFVPEAIEKIKKLREMYLGDIEVDGHQDPEHAHICAEAGANIIACGSFLQKATNVKKAVEELREAIGAKMTK